jgi:four helix bundle protein
VKEKMQFMNIAIGSIHEVQSMLFLASDLNYISEEVFQQISSLLQKTLETSR